jgi:hypothetical protein
MAGWKDILIDVIKLTDEVKSLNQKTEVLSERTISIDKRVVRLETIIEIAEKQAQLPRK